jgi:hypothetical protein
MAENQHQLIAGYRDLTLEEIAFLNEIKSIGAFAQEILMRLEAYLADSKDPAAATSTTNCPHRWLEIGRTDLQTGIMALCRAVAQPTTF